MDDFLFAGEWSFNVFIKQFLKKFESNQVEWDNLEFVGVRIVTKKVGDNIWFELNQCSYIDKLQQIPSNADFAIYRSARAKVSRIFHTQPHTC